MTRKPRGSHLSFCIVTSCLLVALAGCGARGAADRPAFSPADLARAVDIGPVAIAPDGAEMAFATDRSGAPELWTARIQRGVVGTPVQRTTLGHRISGLSYSYLGNLVFSADPAGDGRDDLWLLERGAAVPQRLTTTPGIHETSPRISADGMRVAFLADAPGATRFALHVMELRTRASAKLTSEEGTVLHPVWSPDGKTIVATVTSNLATGELLVVDLSGDEPDVDHVPAARPDGIVWPVEWLPNGKLLARATNAKGLRQLCTVELDSGTIKFVGPDAWDVDLAIANPKNGTVVFSRVVNGLSDVRAIPSAFFRDWRTDNDIAGRVSQDGVVTALAVDRIWDRALVLREESNRPPELFLAQPLVGRKVVAVKARAGKLPLKRLARAELRSIRTPDGGTLDAWVWKPPVSRLGSPPPAVLAVHDGPGRQGRPVFSKRIQALAEAGHLVVSPAWRTAADVAVVVQALAANGDLDPARVEVMGEEHPAAGLQSTPAAAPSAAP